MVAAGRFMEVSQTPGFLCLPAERICHLLSEDTLIVHSELDVFCALLRWLDHDREGRLCHAAHLLQDAVRLHCISPECIVTKVEPVEWLFDAVPHCLVVINEAMRSVSLPLLHGSDFSPCHLGWCEISHLRANKSRPEKYISKEKLHRG